MMRGENQDRPAIAAACQDAGKHRRRWENINRILSYMRYTEGGVRRAEARRQEREEGEVGT
jgi:hypothetical protein